MEDEDIMEVYGCCGGYGGLWKMKTLWRYMEAYRYCGGLDGVIHEIHRIYGGNSPQPPLCSLPSYILL
jgi:hypothetical protein